VRRRRRSGFTLDLGPELEATLNAFKATYNFKGKTEIVRQALIEHMERELDADPERRRRFRLAGGKVRRR